MKIQRVYIETVTYLMIILFVYAATSKLIDFENFGIQLGQSPILTRMATPVSWLVPLIEIFIAVLLTIPSMRSAGLYWSFTMMVLFTAYIVAILNIDGHIPCSCGGILENMEWTEHLVFNMVVTVLVATAVLISDQEAVKGIKGTISSGHLPGR
jgi:hypothetical protein